MKFKDLFLIRRSTRAYIPTIIPKSEIREILEAGLRAPNACNYQSWHFYCIADRDKIESIVPEVCAQTWIKNTSVVIVITEDNTRLKERWGEEKANLFVAEDAGAAAQNMLLMAAELGYAGCFVGAFDEEKCREFVGADENERPVLILPIGKAASEVPLRDRKSFDDVVTFIG